MKRVFVILLVLQVTSPAQLFSQYKLMRFDENYSGYKDSAANFYNSIKYIPLSRTNSSYYMSFGGEARAEFAYFKNEDWGRLGIGKNPFFLQRYDVHADVHLGQRIRVFGQIRSAWESGRKNGARPIDEDKLNVQNLFLDVDIVKNRTQKLTARVGRQEMDYGSGRLISVREGPNLRLYFDGVKLMYEKGNFKSDAFVMITDTSKPGAFDNKTNKSVNFWGSYNAINLCKTINLEFYYLGIQRKTSRFEEGLAKETRHSIGGRFWRYGGGFIYNFESLYQFGKFGNGNINAWTASAEVGYYFDEVKGTPTVNLRNDYISGDRHPDDGNLQTFNPLYPKGGYFGFDPQIGPVNLIDIHPYASMNLGEKVTVQGDVVFNWRYSTGDGIYRPSGTLNLPSLGSSKRYIGTAYLGSVVFKFSPCFSFNTGVQYFKTGSFLNDVIPQHKDGLFINSRVAFKF